MNKRQVMILWGIAIALAISISVVKLNQNHSTQSTTQRSQGQTLFETFPATDIANIEIQGVGNSTTLLKKEGKWVIEQRDQYPANGTFVNDLIRTLTELKVTLGLEAGPSLAPRFGMDETSTVPNQRGLTALFKDANGKELAKVSFGKTISSAASASPMGEGNSIGRYVRNHADESGFYAVNEMFPSISAEPKRWLVNAFISPEKIKSISLTAIDSKEVAWELTRESEEAQYKLTGATAEEVLGTNVMTPLNSLFSYATFEDIVPKNQIEQRKEVKGKRIAVLETFEGFRYTIQIYPLKSISPASTTDSASQNAHMITVEVAATLPKERKKGEGEKPEDAKAQDAAFSQRLKTLTEKLAQEKAFADIAFEVSSSMVEPLLKERSALIAKAPAASASPNHGNSLQKLPGGMIVRPPNPSATTVPVEASSSPQSVPDED